MAKIGKKRSATPAARPKPRRAPANAAMLTAADAAELDLLQRLRGLGEQHRDGREGEKIVRSALRLSMDYFQAADGCAVVRPPGGTEVEPLFSVPRSAAWDIPLLSAFLAGENVPVPADQMFARIRRHERMWGLLVVRSPGKHFPWDARRAHSSIGSAATQLLERADQERIREVRMRIDRKILEQLRPQDLFYQILHGIRSLTGYDHSAALLICDNELDKLEVVAEQIAWSKAKSRKIGLELPLSNALRQRLLSGVCYGFDRLDWEWHDWSGHEAEELADLLDYNLEEGLDNPHAVESAMLCAPLATRSGLLGVLKVSAAKPRTFSPYEARLISGFLVQASIALQNLRRTESLEIQVIAAERKHAMADLARGVSHDVNNALGGVLPLVQQLQADLEHEQLDVQLIRADLSRIEHSLQACRRIFGGMLSFARGGARAVGPVHLRQEIDCTLAILKGSLQRHNIQVQVELESDLPTIQGVRADVEQLLLNLLGNARDAMQQGGTLAVRGKSAGDFIELQIEDTGCGIPAAQLSKVQEPFFTTKRAGSGLGLSICRSIVSELGGKLHIESRVGEGTSVRVTLPVEDVDRL